MKFVKRVKQYLLDLCKTLGVSASKWNENLK